MTTRDSATASVPVDFGANRLVGDRLVSGSKGWIVKDSAAYLTCGQSSKGPDVGRAILGLIGGAILGALIGFVIFGGIITMAVFAIVIGLVSGLKPVEHGKAWVTIDLSDGTRQVIEGPLDRWQDAQRMTDAINALRD